MQHLFGYSGVTQTADDFWKQSFNEDILPPMSQGATSLLKLLSNNSGLPPISTIISQEEFEKALRKWSEGTSKSPRGRHLVRYRCLFVDDGNNYTNNDPDPSDDITGVYYNITTATLEWGITLD
jgi:hypothetical protein